MFGSVSVALGVLSTVTSLLKSATGGVEKAAAGGPSSPPQQFDPIPPSQAAAKPAPLDSGVVLTKFDKHTQAALLALQERQYRA